MSGLDLGALKKKMEGYDEDRLVGMVAYDRDGYRPEVIELAEQELASRGYSDAAIRELRVREHAEQEQQRNATAHGIIMARALDEELSTCHLCSRSPSSVSIPFGLAAMTSQESELDPAASVALSIITVPLLGAGLVVRKQMVEARVLELRLRLCDECAKAKRWLGGWNLSQEDYELHPSWQIAQSLGFDRFVGPDGLQRSRGYRQTSSDLL